MQARFLVHTFLISLRLIDFLKLAARGVFDNQRPGLISLAQSHSIRIARSAVFTNRFVRTLGDVRSAHHDSHTGGAYCAGDTIGFRHHSGHRTDADKVDFILEHIPHDLVVGHCLRVAVNQNHFMSGWCQLLKQKHPEVGHEVSCHAVVRVIQ